MITISLCMIVKNEEDVLARCLDSLKDIVDEIIIVDTGSTDKTKEIAKKYTKKVYDFEWIDDFSAARNFSFSKATMDYILWLDADDIIFDVDREKLKQLKLELNINTVDTVMMKYNVGFDKYGNITLSYFRERLIKRINNCRWVEPIHEYIQVIGNSINSDICITHKKERRNITNRNLAIYEKLLLENKELSVRGLYYYARELYYHERYIDAIKYFNKFLDTQKGWIEDNINACFHLSVCYNHIDDKNNMLKILLQSFIYDSPRADICCQLGYYYLSLKEYEKAIYWYHSATQLKKPTDNWGFISHDYYGYIPNIQLCLCHDKLGHLDEAIKYNNKAAEYKPNNSAVIYNKKHFESITRNINNPLNTEFKNLLDTAEKILLAGNDKEAMILYIQLLNDIETAPIANFRLGEIENRRKNIKKAYNYHKKAFELDNHLTKRILKKEHPHYNYEYKEIDEIEVKSCPLCSGKSQLHSCFNIITNLDQIYGFNPIKIWRICNKCNHIFTERYPKNLEEILSSTAPNYYINPNVRLFPILSSIVSNLKSFAPGNKLLEVGVGAGEMISVAKEMLFDVAGLDIRPVYAKAVSDRLNVPVYGADIMKFDTDELYDVIILGDIIEHVRNPIEMIIKCYNLLNQNGVIWISTPNFESAFSYIMKDKDPMWRVCEHLNYFSYTSLKKVLNDIGFEINDYKISQHYNGSMEIIAKK
ncbi:MAG TPA: hypothetical protein DCP90_07435 [Clostridiales bacterium]|nr:MAG: hypothetical protein A2Y22_04335 [Clostridiales bacterium GWD2_32_59]HAN10429.1 hypothetical protein [Clostridiales bacterium]